MIDGSALHLPNYACECMILSKTRKHSSYYKIRMGSVPFNTGLPAYNICSGSVVEPITTGVLSPHKSVMSPCQSKWWSLMSLVVSRTLNEYALLTSTFFHTAKSYTSRHINLHRLHLEQALPQIWRGLRCQTPKFDVVIKLTLLKM